MAASARASAVAGEMTADEQAQLDQMRADDGVPVEETVERPQDTGGSVDSGREEPAAEGAEGGEEPPAPDGRPRMVPHAAMHEERVRRQSAEQRLADSEKARQTLEERTNLILQRFPQPQQQPAQQQPQAAEIPSVEQDPVGHIVGVMQQQGAVLRDVIQALIGIGQQNQQAQAVTQLGDHAKVLEAQYAATTPDYNDAVGYLRGQMDKELQLQGWSDPGERVRMLNHQALQVAANAIQNRRNPAEDLYNYAKLRGYQQAPAAQEAPQASAAQRLDNVARGQQQSARSLGNVRGSGPAPMTAATLAAMSDNDFMKMMDTPEGKALMGS